MIQYRLILAVKCHSKFLEEFQHDIFLVNKINALNELKELTTRMTDVMYELEMREMYFNDNGKTKFVFDNITIEN